MADSWEQLLRKMLPEGAPLPNEDQLDYSISIDYEGDSPFSKPPTFSPISTSKKFTTYPKHPPSLTPNRLKSPERENDDDNNMFSVNSCFIDRTSQVFEVDNCNFGDVSQFSNVEEDGMKPVEEEANRGMKCRRCHKVSGGLFKRKVRCKCIVCGSMYCRKCVLKAMGSMPEGRKCVECIGKPIDESYRCRLGKCTKFWTRVCSGMEVKRIMERERECEANRVRADQVIVNARQLVKDELDQLLGCRIPLKGLRPGRYWYDKESGLWGKEGHKPDRIISSRLHVGAKLQTDASNGSTKVYMNGREITKVELKVLKLAKVQCLPDTHFWVYEDGSYEEEGQNNIKGCIWEKASIRFLCSLLSLPVPHESTTCRSEEESSLSPASLFSEHMKHQSHQKLLLLGLEGSGTSTIFKQAKLLYANKFTHEELQHIKILIQRNIYRYLTVLLEGRERFEEEALAGYNSIPGEMVCDRSSIYSVNQKTKQFSDWFLGLVANGEINTYFPAAAREYAPLIHDMWKNPAILETYKRRNELLSLPDVAKYFLDQIKEISGNDYEPSAKDILFAEDITRSNSLACIEFSFDDQSEVSKIYNKSKESQRHFSKYQLLQFSFKGLHSGQKWLERFEDMNAVVFCVSLCDYDQLWTDDNTSFERNKMLVSRDFFETIARKSCFKDSTFVLVLNKYDLFEDKIEKIPLTNCEWFRDFSPLRSRRSSSVSLAQQAFHYIAVKFKEVYASVTGRKLSVCQVGAHDGVSVDGGFRYIREVLEWEKVKCEGTFGMRDDDDLISSEEISYSG